MALKVRSHLTVLHNFSLSHNFQKAQMSTFSYDTWFTYIIFKLYIDAQITFKFFVNMLNYAADIRIPNYVYFHE